MAVNHISRIEVVMMRGQACDGPFMKPLSLGWALLLAVAPVLAAPTETELRALISRADLNYPMPVARSEEGLPVGNGRMGSLVWTSPTALRFQINRVDVQPISGSTTSFFERNSDYMGGCGFVDLDFGGALDDVFVAKDCPQRLAVYDGLVSIAGKGVSARVLALPAADVMAVELEDRRAQPQPIAVNLRMLRQTAQHFGAEMEVMREKHIVTVRTRQHTAASQLHIVGDRIVLTQEFREGSHFARSALAVAMIGRAARPSYAHEAELRLTAPAGSGRVTVLMASAATLDPAEDVMAQALRALDAAERKEFAALQTETAAWWHAFWDRGSLALHSADGVADTVAENYHYFLYLMAATSRGKYPPKFNGMLWNTAGDLRAWGAQHWFANLSCYYEALYATNRLELLDPVFDMYSGMIDASATAARQQWGSEGIYIPETAWFDGLAPLPDEIAAELRDLFLLRKPWSERSTQFLAYAASGMPHSSRWNFFGGGAWVGSRWVPTERGFGPYGPVSHILGSTAKIAYLYWRRYEYTLDRAWLQARAYPMLKGAAEFYRHFPNLRRGDDGLWHIHHVNSNESMLGARDTDEDLSAMRGVLAAAIRAAELLEIDAPLRAQWREVLDHLAPLPTSTDVDALKPADYAGPRVFVRGRTPAINARGFTPDGNSLPMWFFDLCNLDSPDHGMLGLANATFDRSLRGGPSAETPVGVLSKLAIAGVTLGRVEATRFLVPNQMRGLTAEREGVYRGGRPLANRLALREGAQALDAQRLGRAADALQLALLNSNPPAPAAEPALRLFAAWPPEWEATFTLRARGALVVTASQKDGRVSSVEILSEVGAPCRLHNPWGEAEVLIQRDGTATVERMKGALLTIPARAGERLKITALAP
jgi:hypothetical protein